MQKKEEWRKVDKSKENYFIYSIAQMITREVGRPLFIGKTKLMVYELCLILIYGFKTLKL